MTKVCVPTAGRGGLDDTVGEHFGRVPSYTIFDTETQTVKIGRSTRKKLEFELKKIAEGERKSIAGSSSDADKIINPGEVNIRPPGM